MKEINFVRFGLLLDGELFVYVYHIRMYFNIM
jgi:hypothetical protein